MTMRIEFAPWNVPLKRRLETLGALLWFFLPTFGSLACLSVALYLIIATRLTWLILLYFLWMYFDRDISHRGGRRLGIARRLACWKHLADYFPLSLVKTVDLPADRNYLLCAHPHGLLCAGAFGHFCTDTTNFSKLFPGLRGWLTTLDLHFNAPFLRELVLALGFVSSSKRSIKHILTNEGKGNALALIVGGATEAQFAVPGDYKLLLKNRKGFIKIALETGTDLVPVFSFGEIDIYNQVAVAPGSLVHRLQMWIKKTTGFLPVIPAGRGIFQYSFGFLPRRHPVTTVVGRPISVPKVSEVTTEVVDKYHKLYTEALIDLFEEHKDKYIENAENRNLILL